MVPDVMSSILILLKILNNINLIGWCMDIIKQILRSLYNAGDIFRSFYQTAELTDVSPIALNTGKYDTDVKVYQNVYWLCIVQLYTAFTLLACTHSSATL